MKKFKYTYYDKDDSIKLVFQGGRLVGMDFRGVEDMSEFKRTFYDWEDSMMLVCKRDDIKLVQDLANRSYIASVKRK